MSIVTTSNNSCKTFSNFFPSDLTKQANDAVLTFTRNGIWNRCLNAWKAPSPAEHLLPAVSHEAVREYAAGAGAIIAQAIADGKVNSWRGPDGTLPSPDAPKPARRTSKKTKTASKPQHVVAIPPARTDAQVIQAVSVPAEEPQPIDRVFIVKWHQILSVSSQAIGLTLPYNPLTQTCTAIVDGCTIGFKVKFDKDGKPIQEPPLTIAEHKLLNRLCSDLTANPAAPEIAFSHKSYFMQTRRAIPAKTGLYALPATRKPGRPKKAKVRRTSSPEAREEMNRKHDMKVCRRIADRLERLIFSKGTSAPNAVFKYLHIRRGDFHACFDDGFKKDYRSAGMNAYPKKLLQFDERQVLAYQKAIAYTQRDNITANQIKGTNDRITNGAIDSQTCLSRRRTTGKGAHGWRSEKERSENANEYLVRIGILDDWHYCKKGGVPLTDEEADFATKTDYDRAMTCFRLHDHINWLERQNKVRKEAQKNADRLEHAENKVLREAAEKAARAKLNGIPQDSAVIAPQQGGVAIPPPSSSGVVIPPARPQAVPQAVSANPQQDPQVAIPPSSGVAIPPSAPQAVMAEKHVSEVRTSSPRDFVMKETFEPGEADYIADCLRQYEKNPSFCLCRENLFITFCGLQSKGYRPATIRDWLYHAGLTHCAEAADQEIKTIAAYPDYDVFADVPEPQVPLPSLTAA